MRWYAFRHGCWYTAFGHSIFPCILHDLLYFPFFFTLVFHLAIGYINDEMFSRLSSLSFKLKALKRWLTLTKNKNDFEISCSNTYWFGLFKRVCCWDWAALLLFFHFEQLKIKQKNHFVPVHFSNSSNAPLFPIEKIDLFPSCQNKRRETQNLMKTQHFLVNF